MGAPAALEADVKDLRAKINTAKTEEAVQRKAADDLVEAKKKAGGEGFNILADKDAFEEVDAAYKLADTTKDEIAELTARLTSILGTESAAIVAEAQGDPEKIRHLAQRFTSSGEYQDLIKSGRLASENARVDIAPVEVMDIDEAMASMAPMQFLAATLDGSPLVPSDRQLMPPIAIPVRGVRLLDLITVGSTESDSVEYTKETTRTDASAGADFGTLLPEAAYAWSVVTANVKRRGHHITATKGNLADQRQMQTLVDGRLVDGVRRDVETQSLAGDGIGQNFPGILTTAGIGTQALGVDTVPDAIHKAMTVVRIALEDDITAIGLHPTDYQTLMLAKGTDGHYLHHQGPQDGTPRMIWGYPAIISTVFTQGTAVAGNWKEAATLWMRTGITVGASDSHSDYFLKGLVAVAAEVRAAFACTQPKAICQVTGL